MPLRISAAGLALRPRTSGVRGVSIFQTFRHCRAAAIYWEQRPPAPPVEPAGAASFTQAAIYLAAFGGASRNQVRAGLELARACRFNQAARGTPWRAHDDRELAWPLRPGQGSFPLWDPIS